MSTIGELLVQINGDNSGLSKALNQSSAEVSATGKGIQKAIGSGEDLFVSLAGKVGLATIAMKGFGAVMDGIEYNKMSEQAEIAFGVFLGSAEDAKNMIVELKRVAMETPLEFSDVRDAAKQLLAYGVNAREAIPTIEMLTDVSAGLNIPIKDLSYLYGTIKTQQRAMTVDINQFANRGIPIWEELARITGKNGTALRKFVEDGNVSFPIIEKAFQNMTSEGGKFFEMASKQMDSLAGAQSNLNDAWGQFLGQITQGLATSLKGVEKSTTNILNDLTKWDREASPAFFGWLNAMNEDAKDMVKYVNPVIALMEALSGKTGEVATNISTGTANLGDFRQEQKKANQERLANIQDEKDKKAAADAAALLAAQEAKKAQDILNAKADEYRQTTYLTTGQWMAQVQYQKDMTKAYEDIGAAAILYEENWDKAHQKEMVTFNAANASARELADKEREIAATGTAWVEYYKSQYLTAQGTALINELNYHEWLEKNKATLEKIKGYADGTSSAFSAISAVAKKMGNEEFATLATDAASIASSISSIASNPASITGWAQLAVAGVNLVIDAFDQLIFASTRAQDAADKARRDAEYDAAVARNEAIKTANEMALESYRKFQTEKSQITQQIILDEIKMRDLDTEAGKDQLTMEKDRFAVIMAGSKDIANISRKQNDISEYYTKRAYDLTDSIYKLNQKAQLSTTELTERLTGALTQAKLETDRFTQAYEGVGTAIADAMIKGTSEADFQKSIFDMLKKMAVEAAIVAGGYADKFKAIGTQVAAALQNGFSSEELMGIKGAVAALYAAASADMGKINQVFSVAGFAKGTNYAPGGLALVGERGPELVNLPRGSQVKTADETKKLLSGSGQNITINVQSNAPLDPLQTAWQVKQTMQSLAFQGVA